MMQYDQTIINKKIEKEDSVKDEAIRLSENLSYLFRMFLVSMVFIVMILFFST